MSGTSVLGSLSLMGTLGLIGPCAWTFQVSQMCLASLRGTEGRIALVGLPVLQFLWQALSQTVVCSHQLNPVAAGMQELPCARMVSLEIRERSASPQRHRTWSLFYPMFLLGGFSEAAELCRRLLRLRCVHARLLPTTGGCWFRFH